MTKVRLYLDIDGCLNASYNALAWRTEGDKVNAGYQRGFAVSSFNSRGNPRTEYEHHPKYRMEWNERLIEALNSLDVELVWTTTWREDARGVGELMGLTLPNVRVLHPLSGETTFPSIEWKRLAVVEDQKKNPAPLIWVDDELFDPGYGDYGSEIPNFEEDNLLIQPNSAGGIAPAEVAAMKDFIAKHAQPIVEED